MSDQNYLKPAFLLVSGRIVSQFAAIVTFLLCARFLTAELFGAFALASAIVMVLAQLTHVGFHEYILKERLTATDAGSVWIFSLLFGLALGILIILLAHPMALLFGTADIERLMIWWSVTPIVSAITSVMTGLAYNEERYTPVVCTTISIEALSLVSVAFFLWHGLALDALLIQRLLITVGPALVIWVVLRYPIPFKADRAECWRIFHFAKHLSYSHVIGFGSNYGADMALGFVAGPAATGLYRFGARIVIAISTVSNMPLSTLAWTNFSKVKNDAHAVGRRIDKFLPAITLVAGVPLAGLAVIADPLITRVAPAEWQASIIVVQILALIGAVRIALTVTVGPALGVIGQERWIAIIRLINAIFAIGAILILARYGVTAAALSQLVPALVIIPLSIYLLRKHAGINVWRWFRSLAVGAMASAAMWGGVHLASWLLAPLHTLLYLPALMVIGAAIYIPLIFLLAPVEARWFVNQAITASPEPISRFIDQKVAAPFGLKQD